MDTIRAYISKIRSPFLNFKKVSSPPLSYLRAEYAFLCLNLSKYPWKCLNELLWLCLGSEYAWSSYMFDKLLKMLVVLNKPGIWIWHACVFKGYAGFRICLIMDPYSSIMPKYASICLNVTQYASAWLNIAECLWICLKKLFWLFQGSQHAAI